MLTDPVNNGSKSTGGVFKWVAALLCAVIQRPRQAEAMPSFNMWIPRFPWAFTSSRQKGKEHRRSCAERVLFHLVCFFFFSLIGQTWKWHRVAYIFHWLKLSHGLTQMHGENGNITFLGVMKKSTQTWWTSSILWYKWVNIYHCHWKKCNFSVQKEPRALLRRQRKFGKRLWLSGVTSISSFYRGHCFLILIPFPPSGSGQSNSQRVY